MKPFLIIVAIVVILGYFIFPMVNTQRICYETAQNDINDIQSNVLMRNWTEQKVCESRMDKIFTLEGCIQDATGSGMLATYTKEFIPRIVSMIRPYSKNVFTLKQDHNNECTNFSWTVLP